MKSVAPLCYCGRSNCSGQRRLVTQTHAMFALMRLNFLCAGYHAILVFMQSSFLSALMLLSGSSFTVLSPHAIQTPKMATLARFFFAWDEIVEMSRQGCWLHNPNTDVL